jgi:predicted metal-dependent hydrolase
MQVRFPKWDFSGLRAHWAPHREFAQMYNAASTVPAYIEPYLLKVMRIAKGKIDPAKTELHAKLDIFIKQEMQHCKLHLAFNKAIRADGYEGMLALEQNYEADYDRYLKTRSLRFNLAYSEGFEAMSAIAVTNFFEEFDAFLDGADPRAVAIWKWHLAEEYEHREVAHEVYHELYGKHRLFAWMYRIYGFIYAIRHIRSHTARVADYLLSVDRARMTEAELGASIERQKAVSAATSSRAREHLKAILSFNYNPATRLAPRGVQELLDRMSAEMARAA